jgi:hypothetical protein
MAEVAYTLLVDGISRVFTTTEEITDTDVQAWGFETAYPGLEFPQRLPCSLDIRVGNLTTSSATFEINDVDGSLPALFGQSLDSAEPLLEAIAPGDVAPSSTWGMHVGTECMGPAGQRRQYSCVPGFEVGLNHVGDAQAYAGNLGSAPVSAAPVVWAGRRVCLHRLVRDSTGAWPDLTDATTRNETRVWFGTLTGQGEHESHTWTFSAAGPESWSMGSIGGAFSDVPLEIEVTTTLNEEAGEHVLSGALLTLNLFTRATVYTFVEPSILTNDDTSLLGAATYEDYAAGMNTFLQALANDNTLGTELVNATEAPSDLRYFTTPGQDGVNVQWGREAVYADPTTDTLLVRIQAHEKVWKKLGYEPSVQNSTVDPIETPDKYGQFEADPYTPGFWYGYFYAADSVAMAAMEANAGFSPASTMNNGGDYRRWAPIYPGGTNLVDLTSTGQYIRLKTADPVYLPSSLAVPLPSEPDDPTTVLSIPDVGDCTHQGLVALRGPYRDQTNPEAEVKEIDLVARVAWRQTSTGELDTDSDNRPKLAIVDWPDPRIYGIDTIKPALWGSWISPPEEGGISHTLRPLLCLEHSVSPDNVGYVLARLLASTGAAGGWYADAGLTTPAYGLAGEFYQDVGPNDLGLAGFGDQDLGRWTDSESSTYGVGIPAEMIGDFQSALETMAGSNLFKCKVALGKVSSIREVVSSLLAPTGWCMSLAGGKFGVFDPFSFNHSIGEDGVIDVEALAGKPGDPSSSIPTQRLRVWSPIDRITTTARLNPIDGKYHRTETTRSSDPTALYRAQSIEHKISGDHLPMWSISGADWIPPFLERWREGTRFWARQHFEITVTVPLRRAHEFWPGSVVQVTNPWLVNPVSASYGVTSAPGYVLSRNCNAKRETCELTCLVSSGSLLLYAPAALALGDDSYDSTNHRIFVQDDYLGIRWNTGTLDVDGFIEPGFSIAGGDADIEVFSFNGVSWVGGIYGTVSSIDQTPGSSYIQLTGALTGATWYRDQYHLVVLRDAENQGAAWALSVYAPIGDKDGNYTGSTKTHQFKD